MDVMTALCKTYVNLSKQEIDYKNSNQKDILLPISHGYQTVEIEVTIDAAGNFKDAFIISKEDKYTIIPCTIDSAARSGTNIAPNPLTDRLSYLAGDYCEYYGIVGIERDKLQKYHTRYMSQLHDWNTSEFKYHKICSIEAYLLKGSLCRDLLEHGILKKDKLGNISNFQSGYVRFSVIGDDDEARVYRNTECYKSWIQYYDSIQMQEGKRLSYISGEYDYPAGKSPRRIRNPADNAKIISSNDKRGFTYLGVFRSANDAASIGYKDMQYMHNALRHLITKQGFSIGLTTIVAWETSGRDIPMPFDALSKDIAPESTETEAEYGRNLESLKNKWLMGFPNDSEIMIISLCSFALQGRISISFYESVSASEYMNRLIQWEEDCSWYKVKMGSRNQVFSPTVYEILKAAYGSDKIKKESQVVSNAVNRLLPCVVQNKKFPYDIMYCVMDNYLKSCHESKPDMNILAITCAVIRKYRKDHKGEVVSMSLERNKADRSYLYGRLLAVAQKAEEVSLWKSGKKHSTTAENYQYAFSLNPSKVWKSIYQKLNPYLTNLKLNGIIKYHKEFEDIYTMMTPEMVEDKSPLNELFLIGYYCELNELSNRNNDKYQDENEGEDENE